MPDTGTGPIVSTLESEAFLYFREDTLKPSKQVLGDATNITGLPVIIDCGLEWETVFGATETIHFTLLEHDIGSNRAETNEHGVFVRKGELRPTTQDAAQVAHIWTEPE